MARKLAVWFHHSTLPPAVNDQLEKLAAAVNSIPAAAPAAPVVTQTVPVSSPSPVPPQPAQFKQRWYKVSALVNGDVTDVYVDEDISLVRYGAHGVRLSHVKPDPPIQFPILDADEPTIYLVPGQDGKDGFDGENGMPGLDGENGENGINGQDGKDGNDGIGVPGLDGDDNDARFPILKEFDQYTELRPARYGCFVMHDFTPWPNGNATMRYEVHLIWNGVLPGMLLHWGTAAGAANQFQFSATSTTWTLNALDNNKVTFPAPSQGEHIVIVEFDGTNPGTGAAQWNVWVDSALQTLTTVTNNNVGGLNSALIYGSGGYYTDPCLVPSPTQLFDGGIIEERLYTAISGTVIPPTGAYGLASLILWTNSRDLMQSEYVENGFILLTQTSPSMSPVPGAVTAIPWLISARSSIALTDAQGGLTLPLYSARLTRTYGFPGQFIVSSSGVPTGGVFIDWIVTTPNIFRVPNRAYAAEQKYSLFHSIESPDVNVPETRWYRTSGGFVDPEPIR